MLPAAPERQARPPASRPGDNAADGGEGVGELPQFRQQDVVEGVGGQMKGDDFGRRSSSGAVPPESNLRPTAHWGVNSSSVVPAGDGNIAIETAGPLIFGWVTYLLGTVPWALPTMRLK